MKFRRPALAGLLAVVAACAVPLKAATGDIIVRVIGGQTVLQLDCVLAGCAVSRGLDGSLGNVFLVTTQSGANANSVLAQLLNLTGIVNAELDTVAQIQGAAVPPALTDTTPISYYGAVVPHGYVYQPATSLIRLADAHTAFPHATGAGIVAIIDTGVDTTHPVLQHVLLPGYDFTRNQNGADEKRDVALNGSPTTQNQSPVWVRGNGSGSLSQSTAAVVDQSTAAVVDGNTAYQDFGHGTMVTGLVHLIAPTARILPLKAFRSDGTGYASDILRALYAAIFQNANVLNMSFNLASDSREIDNALTLATNKGIISVAAAGNNGTDALVYPAAQRNVMGIASTDNSNHRSTFSNYGSQLVWVAAPGEGVITTYPFSTYAAAWGTSFSTPQVSGVASVLFGMNPLTDQYSAADSVAHAQMIESDLGHGRIDMFQALQAWSSATGAH